MSQNGKTGRNNPQKRVLRYLIILFVAALCLILFSMAMDHRQNSSAMLAALLRQSQILINTL